MGLMAGMASGVPVVSTAVGMAPDLICDGVTGGLAGSGDVDALCAACLSLLGAADHGKALRSAAREAVKPCDWSVVGRAHLDQVYGPLL